MFGCTYNTLLQNIGVAQNQRLVQFVSIINPLSTIHATASTRKIYHTLGRCHGPYFVNLSAIIRSLLQTKTAVGRKVAVDTGQTVGVTKPTGYTNNFRLLLTIFHIFRMPRLGREAPLFLGSWLQDPIPTCGGVALGFDHELRKGKETSGVVIDSYIFSTNRGLSLLVSIAAMRQCGFRLNTLANILHGVIILALLGRSCVVRGSVVAWVHQSWLAHSVQLQLEDSPYQPMLETLPDLNKVVLLPNLVH